ncbi:gamma-glutamyltransferase [Halioglobus maricola]|uniref:Glutathione hydrolase proenzyme n=2 Tax=Halioglobus maricola TaxID=2601894 RepID=A0A5P9NPM2_9GAMM|nr:gamma-glutamyltransferase [Halioglobus maricola]
MLLRTCLVFTIFVAATGVRAGTGAVAMPDGFSADAAEQVLLDGGNAVDAAIAATFVLAVTYPEAGNIGGGGFMTSFVDGEAAFLDFRERAPIRAHRDMYLDEGGNFQQRLSLVGAKASGVPGTVKGMQEAHARYGSLPWERLLEPAITLADEGFVVPEVLAQMAAYKVADDEGATNFAAYFGKMRAGQVFQQPELAATLRILAADPQDFYTGQPAQQLVAQMAASGGLISMKDLAQYEAQWREPIRATWREYEIVSAPPPSSGGLALVQLLKMRDFAGEHFSKRWHNDAGYVHLLAEIEKRVFADRAEYLGDPDFVDVPLASLLNDDYLRARAAGINPQAISPITAVPAGLESSDTTHFSIRDGEGNAVALTYTLNWEFGSGVVVVGAGYLLNNEMDDFSAKVGVKNGFGVIGNGRNAIEPGKRMLSSMTPTILLRDGEPALVVGTPGGSTIFTSVFQVVLNLVAFDMPLQQAVDSLRFHHQLPDAGLIRHDQWDIPASTKEGLEALGYQVEPNSWGNLGDIQAIAVSDGKVSAAADARGRGVARLVLVPDRVQTD